LNENKSALVTGAAGFLGSVIVELLLDEGYIVYALDRDDSWFSSMLKSNSHEFMKFICCDITDEGLVSKLPSTIDCVIHLAGLISVPESFEKPLLYAEVNTMGTIRLLQACQNRCVRRFVYISTAAVYGNMIGQNQSDIHLTNPLNPYGISKLSGEHYVHVLGPRYDFATVVLRLFNLYGPGIKRHHSGVLTEFLLLVNNNEDIVIFGKGSRTRSFLHVRDAARAILLATSVSKATGLTMNICGSKEYSINEIAQILLDCANRNDIQIIHKNSDLILAGNTPCSGELAARVLGFKPQIDIKDGIKETLDWLSTT
jgi:nucleoside-diphosphate-sugar epimerase